MTKRVRVLLKQALELTSAERAELAVELLASLDGPQDPGAQIAWAAEIERRVAAIDAGVVPLEPWETVKRRIEKEILKR